MRKIELFLIVVVAIFTAFVLPIFNKEHIVELGSSSDIISALCNIALAATAVYAAKKWFQQKLLLNTLDVSHKIALDFEKGLWDINDRLFKDVMMHAEFLNTIKYKIKSYEEVQTIFSRELQKSTTTDLAEFAYLHNSINRLKRNKVFLKNEFASLFKRIIIARSEYLDSHYEYLAILSVNYDNPNVHSVVEAAEILESKKRNLAVIFEIELTRIDINSSYKFD
ncbi:hypothetical protein [Rahnella perminowiae]|uniref:hypothetical protein n=1 Tax=Rahnella perminowiae TaxID=2816244 RepID=UPI00300E95E5